MKRIYLIRHGETQWNIERRMQGSSDSPLTEKGKMQAKKMGEILNKLSLEFDTAYSSPSGRAFNTSEIILKDFNITAVKRDGLKEIDLKAWEGKSREEIEKTDPEQSLNFWKNPHLYNPSEGESFYILQKRASKEINDIFNEPNGNIILVVSHAAYIKSILAYIDKRDMKDLWQPPGMKNCSCFVLEGNNIDDCKIIKIIYPDSEDV